MLHTRVPRTLPENLRFRASLIRQGDKDPEVAQQIWGACKLDPILFLASMAFLYEPRDKKTLPWIPYEFQNRAFSRLIDQIISDRPGRRDLAIEKSRDMGASWMCLTAFLYLWIFYPQTLFIMGSRSEQYVDDTEEPKSLFWKLDFILRHLPAWMVPAYKRTHMKLKNLDNDSVIAGESTNRNFARGGRATAILLDEFAAVEVDADAVLASSADATKCRIFNSTHLGTGTAFYRTVAHLKTHSPEDVMVLHWQDHPEKRKGLYQADEKGVIQFLDPGFVYPEGYVFKPDGRLRSVAYDEENKVRDDREMAQEWDINPEGSDWQYFDSPLIERLQKTTVKAPLWQADVDYLLDPLRFVALVPRPRGPLSLWTEFIPQVGPPQDREYGMGVDISLGQGNSNSAITIADAKTGEMVAQFADPNVKPNRLAEIAVALALCFQGTRGGAFMVWEANGPGSLFGDEIVKLGYRNFYFRTNEKVITKKQTDTPGWWSTVENKRTAFFEFKRALTEGRFTCRSKETLTECLQYVCLMDGNIVHSIANNTNDPTAARANHGDRVISAALACKAIGLIHDYRPPGSPETAQEGSLAFRREKYRRDLIASREW